MFKNMILRNKNNLRKITHLYIYRQCVHTLNLINKEIYEYKMMLLFTFE